MRAKSDKRLIEAIRIMRDYCCDGRLHPIITGCDFRKARRILRVIVRDHQAWFATKKSLKYLREVGLDPESLSVIDELRWSVAKEMADDPAYKKSFPIGEFRRRLAVARLREPAETEDAPEPGQRRVILENLGIELE